MKAPLDGHQNIYSCKCWVMFDTWFQCGKEYLPWLQNKESAVELDTSLKLMQYSGLSLLIWEEAKIYYHEIKETSFMFPKITARLKKPFRTQLRLRSVLKPQRNPELKFTSCRVRSIQAGGINQEQLQGQCSKRIKIVFIYTYTYTHNELNYAKPLIQV